MLFRSSPAIFEHLERLGQGTGGEIQLTDGIAALMREEAVYAYRFSGKRHDCGSKLGYLQATVEYALSHPVLGRDFRKYIKGLDVNAPEFREETGYGSQKSAPEGGKRTVTSRRGSAGGNGSSGGATNGSGVRTHARASGARRRARPTI